jgi:hypothetical protein
MKNNDLVLRLRDDQTIAETLPMWSCDRLQATMHAAANVIESLEGEVVRLRAALEIIAGDSNDASWSAELAHKTLKALEGSE